MAIRPVPPASSDTPGNATTRRREERSFAALYEQARRAAANDSEHSNEEANQQNQNRKTLEELHERVDTLRGELLVRVIQSAQAPRETANHYTGDISRLSNRLDSLRQKLNQEEARLSGKVFDETV